MVDGFLAVSAFAEERAVMRRFGGVLDRRRAGSLRLVHHAIEDVAPVVVRRRHDQNSVRSTAVHSTAASDEGQEGDFRWIGASAPKPAA